jgi:23S rRNA (guanosine2251-2'-O)-methyltransferase
MIKKQNTKKQKVHELVYGVHPILELLKAKRRKIFTIYTTKPAPKAWEQIAPLLSRETQVQYVARDILTRMAGTSEHQSVVAWAGPFVIRKKVFTPDKSPFLALLDGIQDPRNLGAILRSSYCTGIDGVIICDKQGVSITATVLKASAGLAEHLEIYQATSAIAAAQELKKAGYSLYLAVFNGQDATCVEYTMPMCVVIGNEGTGITRGLLPMGAHVTLPQRSSDISYNASVAAGILLFLIANQQKRI